MLFGKKKSDSAGADAAAGSSDKQQKPCCASKEPHDHPGERGAPSVFEFFSSGSDEAALSLLGQCQPVEGGINACMWVPTSEQQHKIVF
jgi:hypothetical protein